MINKKILIITYYWFPFTGTGVYRISKFVKYLKRRGWEPVILTAEKSTGNLVQEEPEPIYRDIPVYRTPIFEPAGMVQSTSGKGDKNAVNPSVFYRENKTWLQKLSVWARTNILIPDAKISWRFLSIPKGKEVIRREEPALILSTSPPPTAHLVARKLSAWSGLPWVADFRDPWTNIYYYDDVNMNRAARWLNRRLERSVLESADRITLVNDGFFPERDLQEKSTVIENGFDNEDFDNLPVVTEGNDKFTICYTGSLKMNQYPENFIEALRLLSKEDPDVARRIRLEFYGHIEPRFREELQKPDIHCESRFPGLVTHREAIRKLVEADLLFILIGKSSKSKLAFSTKLFEYMRARKPVLGIGHPDGAAARLVNQTGIGSFFSHSDPDGVKDYIKTVFSCWEEDKVPIEPDDEAISRYDFEHLTGRLEKIISELTA